MFEHISVSVHLIYIERSNEHVRMIEHVVDGRDF